MAIDATVAGASANSYVTVAEATAYFADRLNSTAWDNAVIDGDEDSALIQACYRIDQYDFVGIPTSSTQALKWPRTITGINQIETTTVVGTITGDGDATVIVTAAGMTGSPITLSVAVLTNDTPTVSAGKIRTALNANSAITGMFTIGGTGAVITLSRKAVVDDWDDNTWEAPTNDSTLNISIDNGTCTGLTAALTSVNTLAGVSGDLIRNYSTAAIPTPIKNAQMEMALALLNQAGEAVAAGTVSEMQIGASVKVKYAATSAGEFMDTTVDPSGLPMPAARFLKGLRLVNVLA